MPIRASLVSRNGSNGHSSVQPIKRKVGRPSLLNNRIATLICGRMAQGKSLRKICESRRLPTVTTVLDWVIKNPEFAKRYSDAKKLRADWAAQKTIEVAEAATPETAAVARLQVDVYRWHASKLDTQAYGEKPTDVTISNAIHNHFHISEEMLTRIQERRQQLLTGATR